MAKKAAAEKEVKKKKESRRPLSLISTDYSTIDYVSGPLVFVNKTRGISYSEMVNLVLPGGEVRSGQVLEVSGKVAVVQVFEGTRGIDVERTKIQFEEEVAKIDVSVDLLGRVLDGTGTPIDGGLAILPEDRLEVTGAPINPFSRDEPEDFIETGISTIDGLNTLVRGQKLPIFSGSGLPANELTAQIIRQARVKSGEEFAVVFAAMGITHREAAFFQQSFERTGALERVVFFLNLADDPTVERLITPRCALTVAEFLAYQYDMQVLVVLTDMTNYCEALREISTAREEVPGRRGYPGYMYTDLATIYERAGRVKEKKGSITQLIILTMPDDDITHPIPDLTGYITEGQLVLSRQLHRRGLYPPHDVLPSLSRLMNLGIGDDKTRGDHRGVADQLYSAYAQGRDLRRLVAIVGEEALSEQDRRYLKFADDFEERFVSQGEEDRAIEGTLGLGWELLSELPEAELKRIKREYIEKYYIEKEAKEGEEERAAESHEGVKKGPDAGAKAKEKAEKKMAERESEETLKEKLKEAVDKEKETKEESEETVDKEKEAKEEQPDLAKAGATASSNSDETSSEEAKEVPKE